MLLGEDSTIQDLTGREQLEIHPWNVPGLCPICFSLADFNLYPFAVTRFITAFSELCESFWQMMKPEDGLRIPTCGWYHSEGGLGNFRGLYLQKNLAGILTGIMLNFCINLGRIDIFTMLSD